jgi:tetratricopeptide (TPR) repeat protein
MRRVELVIVSVLLASRAGAAPDPWASKPPPTAGTLQGPATEVAYSTTKPVLPAVPSFDVPPGEPGFHHPRELRVGGRKLLGTEIQVKGYILWIYSCAKAVGKPKETPAQTQKRIDEDPTLCERPKFYLGSTKDTALEAGLWVVDVPRPPNKLEKERLPKAELAARPAVPRLAVGDYVIVTGKYDVSSPHAERNSDGLLVYGSLAHATPSPALPPSPPSPPPRPRPVVPAPAIPPRATSATDATARRSSIQHVTEGSKAYGQKQYATAITEFEQAIKLWPDNHVAYYGLGGALSASKSWAPARDAFAIAVQIAPGEAMYHLLHGRAQYEVAIQEARDAEARRAGRSPDEVTPDLASINFDAALASFAQAVKLNKDIWRAHYYLGRIYRDRGDARWAAEELTAALEPGPADPGPWIALCELYRRWDYRDQAIEVALQGTRMVPGAADGADVWYELGMAYDDQRQGPAAITAFSKAVELRRDHAKAKFQRGQVYFRMGDFANARRDLEDFLSSPERDAEFPRQQASQMLMDIAARKR